MLWRASELMRDKKLFILGYKDVKHAILNNVDTEDRVKSKTRGLEFPEFKDQ